MNTNILFIELQHPPALILVLPVGNLNAWKGYEIHRISSSLPALLQIKESKHFQKYEITEIPSELEDHFDWFSTYEERAVCFYKEIYQERSEQ